MRDRIVSKVAGQDIVRDDFNSTGFQILKATSIYEHNKRDKKYSLYWVRRWGESDRSIVMQLGWKIKLSHNGKVEENENKYWKGFTFEINPLKDIS